MRKAPGRPSGRVFVCSRLLIMAGSQIRSFLDSFSAVAFMNLYARVL